MSRGGAWWLCCLLAACAPSGRHPRRLDRQPRSPGGRAVPGLGRSGTLRRRRHCVGRASGDREASRPKENCRWAGWSTRRPRFVRASSSARACWRWSRPIRKARRPWGSWRSRQPAACTYATGRWPRTTGAGRPADCPGGPLGGAETGPGPARADLLPGLGAQRRLAVVGQPPCATAWAARRARTDRFTRGIVVLERKRFEVIEQEAALRATGRERAAK